MVSFDLHNSGSENWPAELWKSTSGQIQDGGRRTNWT